VYGKYSMRGHVEANSVEAKLSVAFVLRHPTQVQYFSYTKAKAVL